MFFLGAHILRTWAQTVLFGTADGLQIVQSSLTHKFDAIVISAEHTFSGDFARQNVAQMRIRELERPV